MTVGTDRETPRVWVGCLACYNAGTLRGEWVDGDEAGDYVPCEGRGHEEWWCFDHEGFAGLLDGECSPMEAQRLAELANLLEREHLPAGAYAAWCSYTGGDCTDSSIDPFRDGYCGEWDTEEEFAQDLAEDLGAIPKDYSWPASYIDWERATRDLFSGDYWSADADGGRVWVFRS